MMKLLIRLFIKDSENVADPDVREKYGVLAGIAGIVLNGLLFAAFIQNDMVILTEMCYDKAYLLRGDYNKQTFAVENVPFVFHTLAQCRSLVAEAGFETLTEAAQDGVSELLAEHINALDEESFSQYLRYHFYCCEQPHMLGHSSHLLFVCRKGGA